MSDIWNNTGTQGVDGSLANSSSAPIDSSLYMARATELQSQYARSIDSMNSEFETLKNQVSDIETDIGFEIAEYKAIGVDAYEKMEFDLRKQITNINNSQNVQVTQAASQLDSMVSGGQFGGNVYRAQQVYSANVTTVISGAMKNVADVTLSFRNSAETLREKYSSTALSGYLQGANMVLSASVDIVKAQIGMNVDMLNSQTAAINDMYKLKSQVDLTNRQITSNENIARAKIISSENLARYQASSAYQVASINAASNRYVADRRLDATKADIAGTLEQSKMIAEANKNEGTIDLVTQAMERSFGSRSSSTSSSQSTLSTNYFDVDVKGFENPMLNDYQIPTFNYNTIKNELYSDESAGDYAIWTTQGNDAYAPPTYPTLEGRI